MPKILFTKLAILIISTILAVFPFLAIASVYINEVAWMGTDNSANDEWVEIYNDGSESVDLSGWMLFAGDGTPSINFSGTTNTAIPAGGFYLLERTDDTTVSSITADLIYVGALSNDGEVLILKDKNGNEADRIDASSGWLAGDNVSKQTMQKTSSVWITANGTPKAVNVGQSGVKIKVAFPKRALPRKHPQILLLPALFQEVFRMFLTQNKFPPKRDKTKRR